MGKKDTVQKDYMSVPKYFADAFNYYLFNGNQFVVADNLSEKDPTELEIRFTEENKEIIQKVRDVLKQCVVKEDDKYTYLILEIENQSFVHYAIPVKIMIYDALNYGQQVSEKTKIHRDMKDIEGDEFLSGFAKSDKLKPIVTLIIYFGAETWDGPRSLKEMFENMDEKICPFVNNYKVNLLIPKEIEDFTKFKTDFGKAMKYISVSDDEEAYEKLAELDEYKNVNIETARLLNECVGMEIAIEKGAEEMEVCKAVKGLMEKGRLEARTEDIRIMITTLQELGHSDTVIMKIIMDKFTMSEEEVKELHHSQVSRHNL